MPIAMGWYLLAIPDSQRDLLTLGISTIGSGAFTQVTRVGLVIIMASATIVLVVYFLAWRTPADFTLSHALAVLLLGLIATGAGEYTRETLRKPYVVGGHMYSNGVRKKWIEKYNQQGYLTQSLWTRTGKEVDAKAAMGEAMFRGQCKSCHTTDAYRSMKRLLAGRNREAIGNVLKMLHESAPPYNRYMPPLVGTKEEIAALGDYLATLTAKPQAGQTNHAVAAAGQ
jgi:mono/diheme cytochrome c family protein